MVSLVFGLVRDGIVPGYALIGRDYMLARAASEHVAQKLKPVLREKTCGTDTPELGA